MIIDLDHFKRLNDAHGHAAGDVVLRHVGQRLAANVRAVDIAGRYGGEEFLVVLPETGPDAAASLAEKLRRVVGGGQVRLPDGELVTVTLSAGVAGGQGEVLAAGRAGPRRRRRAVLGQGARPRPGLRLPGDRRRRDDPAGADQPPRRARGPSTSAGPPCDGRAGRPLAALAGREPWTGQAIDHDRRGLGGAGSRRRPPAGELDRIRTASLLHDLGKLAIPEDILGRPGDLAISEWRVVTEHPKIGQVVLEQAGALRDAANDRAPPPRVVRRPRVPARAGGGRHPDRRPDRVDRRCLRGDDRRTAVPGRDLAPGRDRRAAAPGGRAVRSRPRRGVRGPVRLGPPVGPGPAPRP